MSKPLGTRPPAPKGAPVPQSPATKTAPVARPPWEFGDIGFDTEKRLWFAQLYNENNQSVGSYMGKKVVLKRGRAVQYQWKDAQGRAFWHVRERFFADQVESVNVNPVTSELTIVFKEGKDEDGPIPDDYSYILYAFHLSNNEVAQGNVAPLGFLEFYSSSDALMKRLNNRWIIVEDVDRTSMGDFPKIRLRIEKKDVQNILVTRSAVIIQGRNWAA